MTEVYLAMKDNFQLAKLGESGPEPAKGGQKRFAKENHKENGRVPRG